MPSILVTYFLDVKPWVSMFELYMLLCYEYISGVLEFYELYIIYGKFFIYIGRASNRILL